MKDYTQHIKLLRSAKHRIANRKDMHVCVALSKVCDPYSRELSVLCDLQRWIQASITPHTYVNHWLRHRHGLDDGESGVLTVQRALRLPDAKLHVWTTYDPEADERKVHCDWLRGEGGCVMHDDFKRLDAPPGAVLEPCWCCGANAELWQYSTSETAPTSKAVMCGNGDPTPAQGALSPGASGCPLYMVPNDFYRAIAREAIAYWNAQAKEFSAQRRKRNWERTQVLRAQTREGGAT